MDNTMDLRLELTSEEGDIIQYFTVDEMESWHDLVLRFTKFLGPQYGYEMSNKVLFITDYPFGRVKDQYITPNELEMVLRNRQRNDALDSLWGADE